MLTDSEEVFGSYDKEIDRMMNGIPRNLYPSELSIITLLFTLFDPVTAYMINFSLIHIIAFVGMFFFLQRFISGSRKNPFIIAGISCAYALLPYYPMAGLSVAGLPVALYGFCSINKDGWSFEAVLLLMLYTFYSSGIFTGYFLVILLSVIYLIIFLCKGTIPWRAFSAVIFLLGLFIICDYRLFWEIFFNDSFISHRYDWILTGKPFFKTMEEVYGMLLSSGQFHAASFHQLLVPVVWISLSRILLQRIYKRDITQWFCIIGGIAVLVLLLSHLISGIIANIVSQILWIAIGFSLIILCCLRLNKRKWNLLSGQEWTIIGLLSLVIFISFIYQISSWNVLISIKSTIPAIKGLQLRFYTLLPFIWYTLFGASLLYIMSKEKITQGFIFGIILIQIVFLFSFTGDIYQTGGIGNILDKQPSFTEYYASNVFDQINQDIGLEQNSYRVGSIGIPPAVSQYNGFYTIDGYFYNYPLSYKEQFREIIAPELNKSKVWRKYYDGWGSRAYMYHEIRQGRIKNLELNISAFKELGGRYIFSAVGIEPTPDKLEFKGNYSSNDTPWEIQVYKVR
ncbi:hypothetical protein KHC33_01455 [Methanospirillum sp. J.3.6.1-F.2.7.3]|uniref:Uncharacterized protein n=2 Tax=Methanospirillum purgamenti TaxID=2834276 RepID=A0A8E7B1A8_9EURY|nr:hypothetical protein KHC33_01455 [Methanospirillum sp. J.3.6.1-F.2.7.3]